MPKGDRGKRSRKTGQSYIDIRIKGRMVVRARNREEAADMIRERILEEILTAHPSFGETGLPPVWEEWLEEQSDIMLGVEVREKDDDVIEDLNVTWTNIKGRKLTKGGKISI